ncbi:MAG: bifunctional biotin--[acetyl-CoA-carboxylase] synthetase/biotin operon repressor, partial [Acidaminococcaceae bacterium]|nr:bifunctional biotin--[acetyl-CoA-carboxylase] synthetase/biotin operon repressor [Acidaminococcaceae bacterium]
ESIFQEWRQMTCTLNKDVKVIAQDETYFGRAIDIDAGGMLIVEHKDGKREKVVAGDVSIRSVN